MKRSYSICSFTELHSGFLHGKIRFNQLQMLNQFKLLYRVGGGKGGDFSCWCLLRVFPKLWKSNFHCVSQS